MLSERIVATQKRIQTILDRFEPPVAQNPTIQNKSSIKTDENQQLQPNRIQQLQPKQSSLNFSKMLNQLIEQESANERVPSDLVKAVVKAESNGNPLAVSSKGAIGLMQLMPDTAKELGVDPYNPAQNLQGGIRYLKNMAIRYQDLDKVLAAYNAGPGAVDRHGGVPPFDETKQYIRRIKKTLNDLRPNQK
ncbi:MAG: lytic transglycosylase domain-containing protein [Leptonema sp. (in: Bacteria)]|nr:lytic transglycosylase domain-containing protein [Leptonema sp. (in: bacteria)]